jgi:hypothetical protein
MAANVLNSDRAVEMSVFIVRAFVKIREVLSTRKELAGKLAELDRKVGKHDEAIHAIIQTIRGLMGDKEKAKRRKIGFQDMTILMAGRIMQRGIVLNRRQGRGQGDYFSPYLDFRR